MQSDKEVSLKEVLKKSVVPFLFVVVLFVAVFMRKTNDGTLKQSRFLLGTLCEIDLVAPETEKNEALLEGAFDVVHQLDRLLSNYKEESDISKMNRLEKDVVATVDPKTYYLLQESKRYYKVSQGLFDISIFPLVKLWGFFDLETMQIPHEQEIQRAKEMVGLDALELLPENQVILHREGMEFDLGGIGKGYICDQVVQYLRSQNQENFLVNIGGNIFAAGKSAHNKPWIVGVRHPRSSQVLSEKLILENQAIATSGDYERFFMHEGKRYSHILSPLTGWPVEGTVSVTVVADTALKADVASTTLFLTDKQELSKMFYWLEIDKMIRFSAGETDLEKQIIEK